MKKSFSLAVLVFLVSALAQADTSPCQITFNELPATWKPIFSSSGPAFQLPNVGTLQFECSVLSRELTDVEFSEHIGEEEPEEAPTLRQFGPYRGRIWLTNLEETELQWWLVKKKHMIHLTLKGEIKVPENIQEEVNKVISIMQVGHAQQSAPADASRQHRGSRR